MDFAAIVAEIAEEIAPFRGQGRVANYIPALGAADPHKFGIAVATRDGDVFSAGDADERFSIQSISKVFTFTLALDLLGESLWRRIGREPSGSAFNSLVQLEQEAGIPRNPLINAGAIVVTDTIVQHFDRDRAVDAILSFVRQRARSEAIAIDQEIARSEAVTGFRNAALANFLKSFKNLENPVEDVLDVYFNQCAISASCSELATSMLYLANSGEDPLSGDQVVSRADARRINAVMLTCGHYDASGDFAYRVGLPAKSGVAGGIVATVPSHLAVAVWSPGLSPQGNSLVGTLALEKFSAKTGLSVFRA